MQTTSQDYKDIIASGKYSTEAKVVINGVTYGTDMLVSMNISSGVFSAQTPTIGACVAKEIDLTILTPSEIIPRAAEIIPYVRVVNEDLGSSEWLQKGVFYIDQRKKNMDTISTLTIHGYDMMLKLEQPYCNSSEITLWPRTDVDTLEELCERLDLEIDERTVLEEGYMVQFPGYGDQALSMREVLGYIGAMYCGCWIFNDFGQLRLVRFGDIPEVTFYLIDELHNSITFGGDRIIV